MKIDLTFSDVLINPKFSTVMSRKDVDTSVLINNKSYNLPIISSNMDTVTEAAMAKAMHEAGGLSCLHRFMTIENNVNMFKDVPQSFVSVGVTKGELERFEALYDAGATRFILDVAHGASVPVLNQIQEMRDLKKNNFFLVVGNFANAQSINDLKFHLGSKYDFDMVKVGIGGGAACTTRMVSGVGRCTFSSILDCLHANYPIIADGGIRDSGDFSKAIAAGAELVMLGGMLAGTDESPGEVVDCWGNNIRSPSSDRTGGWYKKYRGSASKESYEVQGKVATHRTPEGEAFRVPYTGPVSGVLQQLDAGLRSSMSYVGAHDISTFQAKTEFVQVTQAGRVENGAHGQNRQS